MVFVDGHKTFVEGILYIFEEFARISGLKISVEKSTLYMSGISRNNNLDILQQFPFAQGEFPVKYLGLLLLTKQMTKADYTSLLENIRAKISSWTARHLSYAGRLQLLSSVISGITNFWITTYRLPSGCIKEIDQICSAFLWSGPELSTKKAKIQWREVCRPKQEGGLGLQLLHEANKTSCLKLIWRILSSKDSLWVNWISNYILKQKSLWELKANTSMGSWMWRKLLKYRDIAKQFHKVELHNGTSTSFWFDNWCGLGCLYDMTGSRGYIDLGIPSGATVASAKETHRLRRHRNATFMQIEQELGKVALEIGDDISLWKTINDKFKKKFNTKETTSMLRNTKPQQDWYKGVWFKYATPKYSFFTWLAMHNRLSTGDRMQHWNSGQNTNCIFCGDTNESRNHLFFSCRYSSQVWSMAVERLLGNNFSLAWDQLVLLLNCTTQNRTQQFTYRYVFQATIYHIWCERNRRRHGEASTSSASLVKVIDKITRNRFSSIRNEGDYNYNDGLALWFSSRPT